MKRKIAAEIESLSLHRKKIAMISGPRQCGKTTLAKGLLHNPDLYFSWDQIKFRQLWAKDPGEATRLALRDPQPRVVFDELHKNHRWKTGLKGLYDEYGDKVEILVTGSARLNTYRKGEDSLLGRFYHFHLHPFSLSEYLQSELLSFKAFCAFVGSGPKGLQSNADQEAQSAVQSLLRFGGFPEPLLTGRDDVHALWQRNRLELLIRQDLRDLTRIQEVSQVEILASLLPMKVGSPLSVQSLREDLEVAFTTVQRWLGFLEALYYHFEVKPYSRSIARSLKKEGKIYLYDWSSVEDRGARFENMVAAHLAKACDYWSDFGHARAELFYLRNKEKQELDFLITKDSKPWFTLEAKLNELTLDPVFQVFQKQLNVPHFQVVAPPGVARTFRTETGPAHVMSFERFFSLTP